MKPKAPCHECVKRSIYCHDSCPVYLQFVEENQRRKELHQQEIQSRPLYVTRLDSPYPL